MKGWIAVLVSSLVACGGAGAGGSVSAQPGADDSPAPPCNPPTAPFAKIMNAAFANEFSACTITTEAAFNAPDWGGMVGGDVEGLVKWSALPGDGAEPAGPFGDVSIKLLYLPKAQSDVLFKLKKGDRITIKGTTKLSQARQVMLYASEVRSAGP